MRQFALFFFAERADRAPWNSLREPLPKASRMLAAKLP
jgi:hypothetical protein